DLRTGLVVGDRRVLLALLIFAFTPDSSAFGNAQQMADHVRAIMPGARKRDLSRRNGRGSGDDRGIISTSAWTRSHSGHAWILTGSRDTDRARLGTRGDAADNGIARCIGAGHHDRP